MRASYWLPVVLAGLMVERYFDLFLEQLMIEAVRMALQNGWYDWRLDVLEFVAAQLNPEGLFWTTMLLAFSVMGLGGALSRRRRW